MRSEAHNRCPHCLVYRPATDCPECGGGVAPHKVEDTIVKPTPEMTKRLKGEDVIPRTCVKCHGAGWVWWDELAYYDGHTSDLHDCYTDDTRYTCDDCEGVGKTMEDFDYLELDCGIRDTVRFFHDLHYETTDSGDGESKSGAKDNNWWWILPYPHVAIVTKVIDLGAAAERVLRNIRAAGVDSDEVEVQVSYSTEDKLKILFVLGLDDAMLRCAAMKNKLSQLEEVSHD